ncbi:MAG: alpha/beta hydrolase [Chloroflexota bacterium]
MNSFERMDHQLLPRFTRHAIDAGDGPIQALVGGSGPPVLLLHGDPQTHLCWHLVAPILAQSNTVVMTDLRGRGESHKPGHSPSHLAYSKRVMAVEQLRVMQALGFSIFSVVGHDRGGRVARRMALDHPDSIEKAVIIDIVSASDLYKLTNARLAQEYFYFYFLTQPHPLPEQLISGAPQAFMRNIITGLATSDHFFNAEALNLYLESASTPASIEAMCECFRAGLVQDVADDEKSLEDGQKIQCPTLILWGEKGVVGQYFDMRIVWQGWADNLQFEGLPCGHFVPEEQPERLTTRLRGFLA